MKPQNKGLMDTELEINNDRKLEERGQTLVLLIDEASLKALQTVLYRVHLGLAPIQGRMTVVLANLHHSEAATVVLWKLLEHKSKFP